MFTIQTTDDFEVVFKFLSPETIAIYPSLCRKIQNNTLSSDILKDTFKFLSPETVAACSRVCKTWQAAANQDTLWGKLGFKNKQVFLTQKKSECYNMMFYVFPKALLDSLGGEEKVKELPYLRIYEPRVLGNGVVGLSEIKAPLTIGHVNVYYGLNAKTAWFSFIAIRFINREFDPNCTERDLNIWAVHSDPCKSSQWSLISGGKIGGCPTRFPSKTGRGDDFRRTIEYIGRLVRGEPCRGTEDVYLPIEQAQLTKGTSTVFLA